MKRLAARRRREVEEFNVTVFLNLMVPLVAFLLVTTVFSRMAVLGLNVPPPSEAAAGKAASEVSKDIRITIRKGAIEVEQAGTVRRIDTRGGKHDLLALSDQLRGLKNQFPDKRDAVILLEPEISYDVLVQVMDVARSYQISNAQLELFPDISLGDARP